MYFVGYCALTIIAMLYFALLNKLSDFSVRIHLTQKHSKSPTPQTESKTAGIWKMIGVKRDKRWVYIVITEACAVKLLEMEDTLALMDSACSNLSEMVLKCSTEVNDALI